MANKTVTVKASAGDYTTLNTALSGESADLVTGTCILTIDCYNIADTTAVDTGTGYTVSSSYYINIVAHDSHGGKYSTEAYRLLFTGTAHWQHAFNINESYTRVTGIQISVEDTSYANYGIFGAYGSANFYLDKIIVRRVGGAFSYDTGISFDVGAHATVTNSLVYGFNGSIGYGVANSEGLANLKLYNTTIVDCDTGVAQALTSTIEAKNVGCSNCTTAFTGAGITQTTCSSTTPTFVNAGAKDYHLASNDTTWINQGTDLSATFTTDIDGTTRPTGAGTWDIGADEYVAAGGSSIVPILLNQYRARRQ